MPLGAAAVQRGQEVLAGLELVRLGDRVLSLAGGLLPVEVRSLDAIHLATAQLLGADLARLITSDEQMATVARQQGWVVVAPS